MVVPMAVAFYSMSMIVAEPVSPSTSQPNAASPGLTIGKLLPSLNPRSVTADAVALVGTVSIASQAFEGNAVTLLHHHKLLPLSNAITVAPPGVVLLCTPPVVASTSEGYNGVRLELDCWRCNASAITMADTFHVEPRLVTTIPTLVACYSMSMIVAVPAH